MQDIFKIICIASVIASQIKKGAELKFSASSYYYF